MTISSVLYIVLALYLVSTFCYMSFLINARKGFAKLGYYFLILGFVLHLVSLLLGYMSAGYTPITNLHESLSFFALCTAGFFIFLKRIYRIEVLGSIFLPVVSVVLISALTVPAGIRPLPPVLKSYWLPIHTGFAFIGNAIFFSGFLISIVYLIIERGIKRKKIRSISGRFPSLETLDRINYKCMSYGFPFLTLGIITGSLWAELAWGSYWSWDPKETWSLITWIVYAILIHNRLAIGWRGRRTAYMMIVGFVSVVVTFLGVNLFIGGLHSYI
ncbi:MAG: Cytochrome c biogenesis protein CcsA [Syntrophorhabdaceae bacterium PtaU1.Bin034]|nr:MAG: Cytochrome c biogenesis protein CcsA [Syntrophorhabdaceae bacterium PtaU1.Bin034]